MVELSGPLLSAATIGGLATGPRVNNRRCFRSVYAQLSIVDILKDD